MIASPAPPGLGLNLGGGFLGGAPSAGAEPAEVAGVVLVEALLVEAALTVATEVGGVGASTVGRRGAILEGAVGPVPLAAAGAVPLRCGIGGGEFVAKLVRLGDVEVAKGEAVAASCPGSENIILLAEGAPGDLGGSPDSEADPTEPRFGGVVELDTGFKGLGLEGAR